MKSNALLASVLVLASPIVATLWTWASAVNAEPAKAAAVWLGLRRLARVIRFLMIALWWALWDIRWESVSHSSNWALWLWILPVASVATSQALAYFVSASILRRKWTLIDIARLTFWSTASATIPLLCIAVSFEFIYQGQVGWVVLLPIAATASFIADVQLRSAEGFRPRALKSGRLHARAFQLSKKLGVRLERVYVVPAGRSHLRNAYGGRRSIAVTDNYGDFASGPGLDFVIGHELMHLKRKHWRLKGAITVLTFVFLVPIFFRLPNFLLPVRPLFDFVIILGPALVGFFVSRRIEYAADHGAVNLTKDPEAAIRALVSLYAMDDEPAQCSKLAELFMTHPPLMPRVAAIATTRHIASERVDQILLRFGIAGLK